MNTRGAEGVLLTGVYGSGKSSVAEEIAYLLEQNAGAPVKSCLPWPVSRFIPFAPANRRNPPGWPAASAGSRGQ